VVIDVEKDSQELKDKIDNALPKTFTVQTGTGGTHYYFLTDNAKKKVLDNNKHWGEIQGFGSQVVGAGSIHPNGNPYTLLNNGGITFEQRITIDEVLKQFIKEEETPQSRPQTTNKLIGESISILDVVPITGLKRHGDEYQGEHPLHGSDTGQNFCVNPTKNVWHCFRHNKGGGALEWIGMQEGLINCGDSLDVESFKKVIKIAEERYGYKQQLTQDRKLTTREVTPMEIENLILNDDRQMARFITANELINRHYFITLRDTEEILVYKNGYYQDLGESIIKEACNQLWGQHLKNLDFKEIMFQIQGRTYHDRNEFNTDIEKTCVKNGILDLISGELLSFSPEFKFTFQLPINYDKNAKCDRINKFLSEIVIPENVDVLKEIAAYILWRNMPIQKSILLLGEGQNGKSVYINLLKFILGVDNVSGLSLQELEHNKFALSQLYGKHANLHYDLDAKMVHSSGKFKQATGGDLLQAEIKFKNRRIKFKNYAKFIFSANDAPPVTDNSYAFLRRWIIIKFPYLFDGVKENKNLIDEITTEEELSGFLNVLIEKLKIIRNNKWCFNLSDNLKKIEFDYHKLADPMRSFLEERVEHKMGGKITREKLYEEYKVYCEDLGGESDTQTKFTQRVKQIFPRIRDCRMGGKNERGWLNIDFKNEANTTNTSNTLKPLYCDMENNIGIEGEKVLEQLDVVGKPPIDNNDIHDNINNTLNPNHLNIYNHIEMSGTATLGELLSEFQGFDVEAMIKELLDAGRIQLVKHNVFKVVGVNSI
jgi:P4 family phage/plasmid primase-like protien